MNEYAAARQRLKAARQRLKELNMPTRGWANTVIMHEALARGIRVDRRKAKIGLVLRHEGQRYTWHHGHTTLNAKLANRVARFKDVTSRLLQNSGVRVPDNAVFRAGDVERAWQWAKPLTPVVLKPHDGMKGADVHVGVENFEDFEDAFIQVSARGGPVLVEQFHAGVEHRCLVVDNKLVAVTRRQPASVTGDGETTIRGLVASKNEDRGMIHKPLELGSHELQILDKEGMTPESTPPDGRQVFLRGTSNIHTGGDAIDVTDELSDDERAYVEEAARAVPGLRLSGMDVLLPRHGNGDHPVVIEINECPMISMHHFPWEGRPRDVAGAILDAMFPETATR